MPFTVLLDQAMREARRYGRVILPSVALPAAFLSSLMVVFQVRYMTALSGAQSNPMQVLAPACSFMAVVCAVVLLLVLAYTAMQVAVVDAAAGRPVDMKRAWRFAVELRVIGTLILVGLAAGALFLVCCIPVGLVVVAGAIASPVLAVLLGIVGGILALVAFLFLTTMWSFVTPVMADEGLFFGDAMRRSFHLVRFNPQRRLFSARPMWKLLALLIVGAVISYIVQFLVSLPFSIPVWIQTFTNVAKGKEPDLGGWLWLQVPGQFLGALAATAVYLYTSFGIALLFFDTRGRKEGTDLAAAIDALAPPPPPSAPSAGVPPLPGEAPL
jgi:hypothetical protein